MMSQADGAIVAQGYSFFIAFLGYESRGFEYDDVAFGPINWYETLSAGGDPPPGSGTCCRTARWSVACTRGRAAGSRGGRMWAAAVAATRTSVGATVPEHLEAARDALGAPA